MALKIKLQKIGRVDKRIYRIIVQENKAKRNGKYTDLLGVYELNTKPPFIKIDRKKMDEWIKKGATPTEGVRKLLSK